MPADSKCLNSAFVISSFLDPGDGILQKLGDDCPCECDVSPHGLGMEVGIISTVRKMEGNFLSKNQGLVVLLVKLKQKAQQSAKRWAKMIWRRLEPLPYKPTVLGWSLEQQ
jgi:hypothetical protein